MAKRGRKNFGEEIHHLADLISDEALIQLAKKKVLLQLDKKRLNYTKTKEMALPVALKGITEKSRITVTMPKPILELEIEEVPKLVEEKKKLQEPKEDVLYNNGYQENQEVKKEN